MKPFEQVPAMQVKEAVVTGPENWGQEIYVQTIEAATIEEYQNYLRVLEDAGFILHIAIDSETRIHNATYRKGDLFVAVTYGSKKTMIVSYYDSSYPDWDGEQIFRDVPGMEIWGKKAGEPADYGAGNYVITVEDTEKKDYLSFLAAVRNAGFTQYAAQELYGKVFCATYVKERMVLTVTHMTKLHKTYISACYDLPLSPHLHYKEEYKKGNRQNTKTTLHIPELWTFGNSFIFQLKNGNFIVSDGGARCEAEYFLDYIEKLADKGKKPVIEAWFISHGHVDHSGVLERIGSVPEYAERIYVEGLYYSMPNDCVIALQPSTRIDFRLMKKASQVLRTTTGEHPKVYRPQTGQRYYFNDISIDILLSQEQVLCENYYRRDFNDSSVWCMFNIEGQKGLFGGDGGTGGMDVIVSTYDREDLNLDLFATLHHCLNTMDYFTDYCTVKTALFTRASEPTTRVEDNAHLKEVSQEWFTREEGPRVLTFPYKVGTAEILPHFEWIYNEGEERPFS